MGDLDRLRVAGARLIERVVADAVVDGDRRLQHLVRAALVGIPPLLGVLDVPHVENAVTHHLGESDWLAAWPALLQLADLKVARVIVVGLFRRGDAGARRMARPARPTRD